MFPQVELHRLLPLVHDDLPHIVRRMGGAVVGLHEGHQGRRKSTLFSLQLVYYTNNNIP